jgi:outer membrane protein insertion porin family
LKFSNFSVKNLLNPGSYKGVLPQGEGQTLTLSGQTNGRYYQAYSVSFLDPWFGGKRPNNLSVSAYYSHMTGINSDYYNETASAMYGGYPYYGGGYGYGYGSYGSYDPYNSYELAYDPNKSLSVLGVSVGYGKRLSWPDDYFQAMLSLNYQMYRVKNWGYIDYYYENGSSHSLSLEFLLQRSSIDNPLYTRYGSEFTFSVAATPPYSLWDGIDYATLDNTSNSDLQKKYRMLEYHKWKFKARVFTPLLPLPGQGGPTRTPVLMSRVEYGFIGSYNKYKQTPFERYYMGGDGMTGSYGMMGVETIGLRGYENGSIAGNGTQSAYAYSRLSFELHYPLLLESSSTIYGLAFVEAGNAWQDLKAFNPFNLKRSAGFGVRIFLPMIGMMGIDWGYGFDYPNYGTSRGGSNFHFVLGQEF